MKLRGTRGRTFCSNAGDKRYVPLSRCIIEGKGIYMKLIIIRHGDPDYTIDSLTEKGWREARLLAERVAGLDATAFYVSPLGRARDTASFSLEKMNREAEILPWLKEFDAPIIKPGETELSGTWDWLPSVWTEEQQYYDKNDWSQTEVMKQGDVKAKYQEVCDGLDQLLEKHGYRRNGMLYQAVKPNSDTIVLFCHFGVGCVMLSHLLGISPMVLWHGFVAAPTSVTTLVTEEREEGIACFRMSAYGDISHLYIADEEPAFAARFCERYSNIEERY